MMSGPFLTLIAVLLFGFYGNPVLAALNPFHADLVQGVQNLPLLPHLNPNLPLNDRVEFVLPVNLPAFLYRPEAEQKIMYKPLLTFSMKITHPVDHVVPIHPGNEKEWHQIAREHPKMDPDLKVVFDNILISYARMVHVPVEEARYRLSIIYFNIKRGLKRGEDKIWWKKQDALRWQRLRLNFKFIEGVDNAMTGMRTIDNAGYLRFGFKEGGIVHVNLYDEIEFLDGRRSRCVVQANSGLSAKQLFDQWKRTKAKEEFIGLLSEHDLRLLLGELSKQVNSGSQLSEREAAIILTVVTVIVGKQFAELSMGVARFIAQQWHAAFDHAVELIPDLGNRAGQLAVEGAPDENARQDPQQAQNQPLLGRRPRRNARGNPNRN